MNNIYSLLRNALFISIVVTFRFSVVEAVPGRQQKRETRALADFEVVKFGSPDLLENRLAIMPSTPYAGRCCVVGVVICLWGARRKLLIELVLRLFRVLGKRPASQRTPFVVVKAPPVSAVSNKSVPGGEHRWVPWLLSNKGLS